MLGINETLVTKKLVLAGFLVLLLQGCKKDDEEPAPTTTTNPVAEWTCTEVSSLNGASNPFKVHIVNGTGDTLLIENFYALGFDKKAKAIKNNDSLFITPLPQAVTPGVIVLYGKGRFANSSSLTMRYVITDGNPPNDTINATFTK